MLIEKSIIFNSTIYDGPMSGQKRFYPENMDASNIKNDLFKRRLNLGEKYGFDGTKIIVPLQKNMSCNNKYPDGKYVVLNDEDCVYQEIDLWSVDIPTDIMLIKKGIPGVMMAYPVADCPVVIMEDRKNGALALAHCGAEYINRELPMQIADSLLKEVNSFDEDIKVYVGPYASADNFTYDSYPKWATNDKVWDGCIYEKDGLYHIDMKKAIINQLNERKIKLENIKISNVDTISSPYYYSNNAAYHGHKEKNGRFLVGAGYAEQNVLAKNLTLHR